MRRLNMKRVKQVFAVILVGAPYALMAMSPQRNQLSPEEQAHKRIAAFQEMRRQKGTPEEQAKRAIEEFKVTPEERAPDLLEAHKALQEIYNDPANNIQTILEEVQRETQAEERLQREEKEDKIKWENTLLFSHDLGRYSRWGLYKRDLVEGGFLGVDIVADVLFYRQLLKRRQAVIFDSLKKDCTAFIRILKKVRRDEEKYEQKYEDQSALGKLFTRDKKNREALLKPIQDHIAQKHTFVGFWGLNKMTVFPLLFRWGFDKLSNWLESQIISYDSHNIPHMAGKLFFRNDGRWPPEWCAYQRNEQGELVKTEKTPFSYINIARFIRYLHNPAYASAKFGSSGVQALKTVNTLANLHIPEFLFYDSVQLGLEFLGLGFSVKMFDSMSATTWTLYCTQHREELLSCLEAYRDALDNPDGAEQTVKEAESKLKEFVEKGHVSKSWLPGSSLRQWWQSRALGEDRIPFWTRIGVVGILAVKGYMLYRSATQEPDEEDIDDVPGQAAV